MSANINSTIAITIACLATACGETECPEDYYASGDMCLALEDEDEDQDQDQDTEPRPPRGDDDDDDDDGGGTSGCRADQASLEVQNHSGETLVIFELSRDGEDWLNVLGPDNIYDGDTTTFCVDSGDWEYIWMVGDENGCDLYEGSYYLPGEQWYFKVLPFSNDCS